MTHEALLEAHMNKRKLAVKSALEHIGEAERVIPELIARINQAFMQIEQRLDNYGEAIDALVELAGGKGVVDSVIQRQRSAQATERLNVALKAGTLVAAEKVSERSVIVGSEFDSDGKPVPPGRVQVAFESIKPEYREKLLGQGIGFAFDIVGDDTEAGG